MTDPYHLEIVQLCEVIERAAFKAAHAQRSPSNGLMFDASVLFVARMAAQAFGQDSEPLTPEDLDGVVVDFELSLGKSLLLHFPAMVSPELAAQIERLDLEVKAALDMPTPPHGNA